MASEGGGGSSIVRLLLTINSCLCLRAVRGVSVTQGRCCRFVSKVFRTANERRHYYHDVTGSDFTERGTGSSCVTEASSLSNCKVARRIMMESKCEFVGQVVCLVVGVISLIRENNYH